MIWVTWRHHRTSLIVSLGIIAALSVTALVSGLVVQAGSGAQTFGTFVDCFSDGKVVCAAQSALTATTALATMLPVLLGALVGVTVFSRDVEQGTHVLGLTQSVSRARWFWMRVLVVFVPIALAAAVLGFVLEWTRTVGEVDSYVFVSGGGPLFGISNLTYPFFQSSGLALGSYTFMALMLGAALALLVRSSIGAIALTMIGVVVILAVLQVVVRPHYAPLSAAASPHAGSMSYVSYMSEDFAYNWEIKQGYVDIRGNFVDVRYDECIWSATNDGNTYEQRSEETGAQYDVRIESVQAQQDREMEVCLREQGVDHFENRYHAADQFRRFQLTEAALVLVLSGAFMIPALWGLRRLKP